jgi:adenosylcobinamide-GDP ribazoletransferase
VRPTFRALIAAVTFLTRVRLPWGTQRVEAADLAKAPAFFPLVGLAIGLVLGGLHRALWPLGSLGDSAIVLGASLLLTGALHEDGLADTCDALGGAVERDRVLEILKDSRIGAFGACALIVSIVGRMALLDRLGRDCIWALPLIGCLARVGPVWQLVLLPYVPHAGAKSGSMSGPRWVQAVAATATAAAALAVAWFCRFAGTGRIGALAIVLTGAAVWTGRHYLARVGGVTGDLLGATEQIGELAGLSVLAWGVR